jgi:NADPH-dependent 2,4-dienoyl-CoA reductase/sulfur reductase-like enzyme
MENYKYLIIGAGMTAASAAHGIREIDQQGSIGMISLENDPPYNRPPLTKGLWKGKPLDSIWRKTEEPPVTLHLGRKIISIEVDSLTAQDEKGNLYSGEKLLLATGGIPRRLPFGGDQIIYFRTLADYQHLLKMSEAVQTFAVIGGGFIGSEIAAALAMHGKKVTMIIPEDGIGAAVYPHDLSQFITEFFRRKGVEIWSGESLVDVSASQGKNLLKTKNGEELRVDGVVAGIGIQPNLELAKAAGLQIGDGIVVDEMLVTSHPGIYAAGDVADFFDPALDKRRRVEHADNADSMGRQAGRNMAGASEPYHHLPFFYSDLFELGYEAVGELNARMQIRADWEQPYRKGVIYYLTDERVRGVLLWNVWDKVPAARKLISDSKLLNPEIMKDLLSG